jgi:glycosyltransferase involved in cell wall biosynthesis
MTTERLRLVWITPSFQLDADDSWSPGVTALAHRLADRNDVVVYALRSRGGRARFRIGNVEVRAFADGPPAGIRTLRRIGPLVRLLSMIRREPRGQRIIHAFWATETALAGAIASRLGRRPFVVSCMGGEPASLPALGFGGARTAAGRLLLHAGIIRANVITAGSRWHAEVLRARIGSAKPVAIMPLGVDLSRFAAAPPARAFLGSPPRMLAVGSLLPVKGHRRLIEALRIVLPRLPPELRGCRLRIVGEGPERPSLEAAIARLELRAHVELAGSVAYRTMPSVYAAADFMALSSHYESQCLALVEALACGLPVVSTPVGLAPELLADGRAGELSRDTTAESLALALERLLLRRGQWRELSRSARQAVLPFAIEQTTERWLDLYRSMARDVESSPDVLRA